MSDQDDSDDGLRVFAKVCVALNVPVMDLIVRSARWVDPAIASGLPVWYPAFHRGMPLFQANWSTPQMISGKRGTESNLKASVTIHAALGGKQSNWTCCHIWGQTSPLFGAGSLTQDPRYYTRLANMVLLPTPLKALTDSLPEVQEALQVCAWNLYGFTPDPADAPKAERVRAGWVPPNYPPAWPQNREKNASVPGLHRADQRVVRSMKKRKADLLDEVRRAERKELPEYPLDRVKTILNDLGW